MLGLAALAGSADLPGCGGLVEGYAPDGQGGSGVIEHGGTGGSKGTGSTPVSNSGACGNGVVDPGEECDGRSLNGHTCATATSGARPIGALSCTTYCTLDTSFCASSSTGGSFGGGGSSGSGGFNGAGGSYWQSCFDSGGVPLPTNLSDCTYGTQAVGACYTYYESKISTLSTQPLSYCGPGCGCTSLTSTYAKCVADGGCAWILGCAMQAHCTSVTACAGTGCNIFIKAASTYALTAAQATFDGMLSAGCKISCQ